MKSFVVLLLLLVVVVVVVVVLCCVVLCRVALCRVALVGRGEGLALCPWRVASHVGGGPVGNERATRGRRDARVQRGAATAHDASRRGGIRWCLARPPRPEPFFCGRAFCFRALPALFRRRSSPRPRRGGRDGGRRRVTAWGGAGRRGGAAHCGIPSTTTMVRS